MTDRPPPSEPADGLPRTVKIDLDTPLEALWKGLAVVALVACLFILHVAYLGDDSSPPDPAFLRFLPWAAGACALFLGLRALTDNYYIADRHRKALFYHFGLAFFRSDTEYLPFSRVDSVIVNGNVLSDEGAKSYIYRIVLIDDSGKEHPFSDAVPESEIEVLNRRAEMLVGIIGCRFVAGKPEHIHTITCEAGAVRIATAFTPLEKPHEAGIGKRLSRTLLRAFLVLEILAVVAGILFLALR
ncbi:MAG TPA: hypothetical protein VIV61_06865 [Candidatus Ozemobacteraceae bacterium]